MDINNIFKNIPPVLTHELFENIVENASFRLERIVSMAHATPQGEWYDQEGNEWVMLLSGAAALRLEDGDQLIVLEPGDHILLPARCRHRVEWTAPDRESVWLALHYA